MAGNIVFEFGDQLSTIPTDPASPVAGDPVIVGVLPGVALTTKDTVTGETTVKFNGVAEVSVKGVTTSASASAVAIGNAIYYVPGNTPKLSKAVGDSGAIRWGTALAVVGSGATATIRVKVGS